MLPIPISAKKEIIDFLRFLYIKHIIGLQDIISYQSDEIRYIISLLCSFSFATM